MLQPAFASNTTGAPEPQSVHSNVASPTSMLRCCGNPASRFLLPMGRASPVALKMSPATLRQCPSCLREGEQRPKFPPSDVVEKWPVSLAKTGLHPQKGVGPKQEVSIINVHVVGLCGMR